MAAAALTFACLVSSSGCESIEVGLGFRTRLDKLPVTALSAALSPGPALGPGMSAKLVITATVNDKPLATVGAGQGTVLFDSFTYEARIASVTKDGVVSLPADPRLSDGLMPHLRIVPIGHPGIAAELDVPVRYDLRFVADFSGRPGSHGSSGFDGLSGSDGSSGSVDASGNMGPGGNGTDGGNGSDGSDGGPGQRGPDVQVWVTLRNGAQPLLQVRATGSGREQLFLVDPAGGALEVDANGGPGGSGGSGGRGGRGGSGGSGFPPGISGQSGRDGFDGHPGAPGAAGTITAYIDPAAEPYANRLHWSNHDGAGRPGASPQITLQPVPAIW